MMSDDFPTDSAPNFDQDDTNANTLSQPQYRSFYVFVEDIEPVPYDPSESAATAQIREDGFIGDWPPGQLLSYRIDCLDCGHVADVAQQHAENFEYLDPSWPLSSDQIARRTRILDALLNTSQLFSLTFFIGHGHDDFVQTFIANFGIGRWNTLGIQVPDNQDDVDLDEVLGNYLNQLTSGGQRASEAYISPYGADEGEAVPAVLYLTEPISDQANEFLTEVVSFNHYPDIGPGRGGPGGSSVPPTPTPWKPLGGLYRLEKRARWLKMEFNIHYDTDVHGDETVNVIERRWDMDRDAPFWVFPQASLHAPAGDPYWRNGNGRGFVLYSDAQGARGVFVPLDTVQSITRAWRLVKDIGERARQRAETDEVVRLVLKRIQKKSKAADPRKARGQVKGIPMKRYYKRRRLGHAIKV